MEALTATVKEQAAQIQKVSAQLEANKPTPQVVSNDQRTGPLAETAIRRQWRVATRHSGVF